jgi:hypothetical protein
MKKISGLFITIIMFACTKQLEKVPQGQLTEGNVFTQASDFILAIDAAYEPLTNRWRGSWDWNLGASISRDWVIGDEMSDDAVKGGGGLGDQEDMRKMETFAVFPTNDNVLGVWRYNYKGINAANNLLSQDGSKAPDLDANTLKRIQGEAYFLRAFYYFRLVVNFGAVPLLVPEKNLNDNTQRASVEEVYAQIEEDLQKAITALPVSYPESDYQRATSGAAHALLAKTYLYRQQWQKCLDEIAETEKSGYALLPNYADNFNGVGEQSKEVIFAARHDAGQVPSQGSILNAVFAPRGIGWGFNQPTQDLINEFEPGDPRLKATVFQAGDKYFDGTDFDPSVSLTGYCLKKFLGYFNPIDDGGIDYTYIRYADVLLWKAECYTQLGNLAEAKAALEIVRARARSNAGTPGVLPPVTTDNKDELLKAIQHERRVELAFEGQRYYDLVRWNLAATVLAKSAEADPLTGYKDYGDGWQSRNALLPIPQSEMDLLGLSQNPGY